MFITVYLGSSLGYDPAHAALTHDFGNWLGSAGHTLVYGGSDGGQMGLLCDAVLEKGGRVIGVIPDIPMITSRMHKHLSERIYTSDLAERRKKMITLGDAFVALPGGMGTLDEITELITLLQIKEVQAPCVMLGANHYWKPFENMCEEMTRQGFIPRSITEQVLFTGSIEEAAACIEGRRD